MRLMTTFKMMTLAAVAVTLASSAAADAGWRQRQTYRYRESTVYRGGNQGNQAGQFPAAPAGLELGDPLTQLNAQRAARGLPPYIEDPALTAGAKAAASARAQAGQFAHTPNDFAYLPPGAVAHSAGCGCWHPGFGFMACNMDSVQYRFAGAGWARGPDGRVFCHLFVR